MFYQKTSIDIFVYNTTSKDDIKRGKKFQLTLMTRWSNLPKKIINKRNEGDNMYSVANRRAKTTFENTGWPQKWGNVEVARIVLVCPKAKGKDDIKCTTDQWPQNVLEQDFN